MEAPYRLCRLTAAFLEGRDTEGGVTDQCSRPIGNDTQNLANRTRENVAPNFSLFLEGKLIGAISGRFHRLTKLCLGRTIAGGTFRDGALSLHTLRAVGSVGIRMSRTGRPRNALPGVSIRQPLIAVGLPTGVRRCVACIRAGGTLPQVQLQTGSSTDNLFLTAWVLRCREGGKSGADQCEKHGPRARLA